MKKLIYLSILLLLFSIFCYGTENVPGFRNVEPIKKPPDDPNLLLISTVDGRLRAVDPMTGQTVWTMNEDAVFRSPSTLTRDFTFLPNPSDGSLYLLKDGKLKQLPFNIPQLVAMAPSKGPDGTIYTAGKKDVWFGIDPKTGEKMEVLSSSAAETTCPASETHTIFIGRTEYNVTVYDGKNRNKSWHVTFNDYSSSPLEKDAWAMEHYSSSNSGHLITIDKQTGLPQWTADLDQPVIALYWLKHDGLYKVPLTPLGQESMDKMQKKFYEILVGNSKIIRTDDTPKPDRSALSDFSDHITSLYVGESEFGLFATEVKVDQMTFLQSAKKIGPPLLEGAAPLALTDLEREEYQPVRPFTAKDYPQSITYKTADGEYLVLGYHELPKLELTLITPLPGSTFFLPRQQPAIEPPKPRPMIAGPPEPHEDTSIIQLLLREHPFMFYSIPITFLVLALTVVWQCGRQWDRNQGPPSRMESFEIVNSPGESKGAQTSKQSNRGSFGWMMKKMEIPEGWMAVGTKLMYSPSDILGTGCEGTVVYRGTFDGREVAVKRVVSEFVRFAHREADLLRESDHHPHVIRYFCMESDSQFKYLALELCICSLNDYVERKDVKENVSLSLNDILKQATDGLAHLHASKIVHRDMKPQNVLITMASQRGEMRAVISDFGLCKRIEPGKNSLSRGIASGLAGTDGWIAPEVLTSASTSYPVDIFSLGCIFYYVLTAGTHPFGKSLQRQANIVNGEFTLNKLADHEDWSLADDLISSMLHEDPLNRLSAEAVLNHPFFWTAEKRLAYFSDVSDRVEKEEDNSPVVRRIEADARIIVCGGWREKICDALKEDLRKFRTYKSFSVRDLLRAMRNKKHHYRELPEDVRQSLGDIPDQFLHYFTSRFPRLLLHVYKATEYCSAEPVFRRYYSDDVRSRMHPIVTEEERIRKEIKEQMANEVWARAPAKTPEQRTPLKLDGKRNNNKNNKNNRARTNNENAVITIATSEKS